MINEQNKSNIVIYNNGEIELDVSFNKETVRLSQIQLCELFYRDKSVISRHIRNIFSDGELEKSSTVAKNATVQFEGGITPQFRWLNGLWVELYFNQEKSLPNGLGEKLGNRLGDTQQNILALMQNNPKISITALASELGISTTATEKHIKTLKEQSYLKRVGSAKGGHWDVKTDEEPKE